MLSAKTVERTTKPGRYRDNGDDGVRGLLLQITHKGARSWVLRYERNGRETMMGLGSAFEFSLKQARERAKAARRLLADGIDPLMSRKAERDAAKLAEQRKLTFAEAAQKYFDHHKDKWRSEKTRDEFLDAVARYAFPVLGGMDVAAIETADVLRAIEPHWQVRSVTVDRVRSRIAQVLDWCVVRGHRPKGENPARWEGHLEHSLAPARKIAPIVHHAAMPYAEVPAFVHELRVEEKSISSKALLFLILASARTREVTGALWEEIDFENRTWIVPASRMKAGKEHRVPLSAAALDLLNKLPREDNNPHVFIGQRPGAGLSERALLRVLDYTGQRGLTTVHGFRSSFRDWAGERTAFAHDICEAALAHVRGDETVKAYARGDLFQKRRKLMEAWAAYCASPKAATAKVLKLREA